MKKDLRIAKFESLFLILSLVGLSLGLVTAQSSTDVVLYASEASVRVGNWQVVSDSTAAGGARLANSDLGGAKLTDALANPSSYFEMTFPAQAGTPYRLWIRGKAQNNSPYNDSIFAQFSGSTDATGSALYRIGTTSSTCINLEENSGFGLSNWGWQDNGWGINVFGSLIYFQSTGTQTLRIQAREDGLSVDQIVLSPASYLNASPGALKNDTTILSKVAPPPPPPPPPPASASNVVIWASDVPNNKVVGNWSKVFDSAAAGTTSLQNPDLGGAKLTDALANPSSYFEMTFPAQAGTPYRLWIRGKAQNNSPYNDSIFAQFSGSTDATGSALYRIGTTSSTCINLEENSGFGLSNWGWQDNGWGINVFGSLIYFQSTGTQTLRIQAREDGLSVDQIVLSPASYLNASPGALKNDSNILQSTIGSESPPPPPPANLPPTVTVSATPTSGLAPLPVSFSSNANDPDGSIVSYSWTFGDSHTATQPFTSNTYTSAGTYTARLTVTDNQGATASATVIITVTTPPPPTGTVTLKVMTWNSQFGNGTDNLHNLDRQATWIANMNADIVAMYEVNRSTAEDQAQILRNLVSSRTGINWSYTWIGKYAGCSEGNLILTKWTIVSSSSLYLSYQRSVAQATINANGKIVNFFATHIDPDSAYSRTQEMIEIKNFASNFAEPRIIAGDFNASPDWPEMGNMFATYYDSWNDAWQGGTAVSYPDNPVQWHTRTRRGRIDYIFYSKGASTLTLKAAQIPDQRNLSIWASQTIGTLDDRGVRPSDHNFMTATFDVR